MPSSFRACSRRSPFFSAVSVSICFALCCLNSWCASSIFAFSTPRTRATSDSGARPPAPPRPPSPVAFSSCVCSWNFSYSSCISVVFISATFLPSCASLSMAASRSACSAAASFAFTRSASFTADVWSSFAFSFISRKNTLSRSCFDMLASLIIRFFSISYSNSTSDDASSPAAAAAPASPSPSPLPLGVAPPSGESGSGAPGTSEVSSMLSTS